MGYGMSGSNYGDYYQGDLFGSIFGGIKKVVGTVAKVGSQVLPGPAGVAARAIVSAAGGGQRSIPAAPSIGGGQLSLPRVNIGAIRTPAVGLTLPAYTPPAGAPQQGAACGGPGYHRNKALARWERAVARGSTAKQPYVVNACVKNRSVNPLNPKALRRAIRREDRMRKMMTRALKGSGYKITRTATRARRRSSK